MEDSFSMHEEPLLKAIKYFGSQQELACALGVSQQAVNYWLNNSKKIPYIQALKIELYTGGKISIESLTDEENELTFLLKNSAFLKGAPLIYLNLGDIFIGDKGCPIYRDNREAPAVHPTHFQAPILVDTNNKLIACECRLRAYPSIHSKVKVCRLNISEMIKNNLNMDELISTLPISERVEVGLFIEGEIGNRRGKRTDLELRHAYAKVKSNCKKREIATKIACFRSHFTYSQAKEIVKNGLPEVIKAVDDGSLTISTGHRIANLPADEQDLFIAMMHKKNKRSR
jgi:DNA-binding transcriptional regulator YdaS (Cro superfamily)